MDGDFSKYVDRGDSAAPSSLVQNITLLGESFHNAGIVNPYNGAAQLLNEIGGGHIAYAEPVGRGEAAFGTSGWHAQHLGAGLGMAADFYVLSKVPGVNKIFGAYKGSGAMEMVEWASARRSFLYGVSKATTAGLVYEGVFRPVDLTAGDFWKQRGLNAANGALVFGAAHAIGGGVNGGLSKFEGVGSKDLYAKELAAALVSGLGAGVVSAHSNAFLYENRLPTKPEIDRCVYEFATLNVALSGWHRLDKMGKDARESIAELERQQSWAEFYRHERAQSKEVPKIEAEWEMLRIEKIAPEFPLPAHEGQRLIDLAADLRTCEWNRLAEKAASGLFEARDANPLDPMYQSVEWQTAAELACYRATQAPTTESQVARAVANEFARFGQSKTASDIRIGRIEELKVREASPYSEEVLHLVEDLRASLRTQRRTCLSTYFALEGVELANQVSLKPQRPLKYTTEADAWHSLSVLIDWHKNGSQLEGAEALNRFRSY